MSGYNLPMQNKFFPYIALAIGISALSLSAMFVRWAEAPGPVTGFYRLLISTIFLTPLFIRQQKQLEPIDKKYLFFPLLAGIFTAFDFAFWNSSLKFTTAANATLLGNTSPLWVALFALFIFREKLRGIFWLGLLIALTGAVLVMGSDFLRHPTLGIGDLMASTAAIFYAAYQLTTQRGRKYIDPLPLYMACRCQRNHRHVDHESCVGQFIDRLFHANMDHLLRHSHCFPNDRLSRHHLCTGTFTRIRCFTHAHRATHSDYHSCHSPAWRNSQHHTMDRRRNCTGRNLYR